MKSFKKFLFPTGLGLGSTLLDWFLNNIEKPFLEYMRNAAIIASVGFIAQYIKEKESEDNLLKYIQKKLFSETAKQKVERTLVERINETWIKEYYNKATNGVEGFNVTSTFYKLENNFVENWSYDFLNKLPGPSFDDYSSVAKKIYGSKPKLIITGDQGSGKTLMMMDIVNTYVTHALSKTGQRNKIPVVLNMSTIPSSNESWPALFGRNKLPMKNEPYQKFEAWIIDQIKLNYKIYYKDLKTLMDNNQIIYFFDGIDDLYNGFEYQNHDNESQKEIFRNHLIEIKELFHSYVDHVEKKLKKDNPLNSTLSYVIACRRETLTSINGLNNIRELVSLKPLSEKTIKSVLKRQDKSESNNIDQENYYPESLYDYMFGSLNKVPKRRKKFALTMAENPYLLTVMRKLVSMIKTSEFDIYDEWFSDVDEQKFKLNLLDRYVNETLNNNFLGETKYQTQFPNTYENIRWLANMSRWTKSSEFILEDLQPFEHINIRYSGFPSKKLIIYWSIYVLPILIFMLTIIALPVGISIFYEWNFHNSGNSLFEKILNKDIFDKGIFSKEVFKNGLFSKLVFEADVYKPGLKMGIESFLWTSLVLIFTIPLAFIYGSMRLSEYYPKDSKKSQRLVRILQNFPPIFTNRIIINGGGRFAIFLAFALSATRFVLMKHSYNSETSQVFDNNVALINFIGTFIACTALFIVFSATNLLSEDLYVVNRVDNYKFEISRAIYAALGGIGVTIFLLTPIWAEKKLENENLVIGRALAFGGVLTICLPLLFSFKPVSDIKIKTTPNHGIRQHLKNSTVSFVLLSVTAPITLYVAYNSFLKPPSGFVNAITGVSFGVLSLMYGFLSVCRHYAIRKVLSLPSEGKSEFPFQATSFLEYIRSTGLVRIVGGRYMFEHSLLMEYFSSKNKPA